MPLSYQGLPPRLAITSMYRQKWTASTMILGIVHNNIFQYPGPETFFEGFKDG
jgi:hypothetical protein